MTDKKIFLVKGSGWHDIKGGIIENSIELTSEELEHAKIIFGLQLIETKERVGKECPICEALLKKLDEFL